MPEKAGKHHIPVLADEVLSVLAPARGDSYLDLTAGYGGHANKILAKTGKQSLATLVDRDESAISLLKKDFPKATIIQQDFLAVSENLLAEERSFDLVLADLGTSSVHLNDRARGFSFQQSGPLDMRMDERQELTAERVVNSYRVDDLANILKKYGEEPKARQIAKLIVANRPLSTTSQLADVVKRAWPGHSKIHPATRTFQAIRIEVNDELNQLKASLPVWINLLAPNGRLAIISFHSLEDRIVKQILSERGYGYEADINILTKRPITASPNETVLNPRARSAKLRAAVKIKKLQKRSYKMKGDTDAN